MYVLGLSFRWVKCSQGSTHWCCSCLLLVTLTPRITEIKKGLFVYFYFWFIVKVDGLSILKILSSVTTFYVSIYGSTYQPLRHIVILKRPFIKPFCIILGTLPEESFYQLPRVCRSEVRNVLRQFSGYFIFLTFYSHRPDMTMMMMTTILRLGS